MEISTVIQAIVKGTSNFVHAAATPSGSLLTTPYGLPYAKWVAENKGWKVQEASLVAAVVAPPTTTAGLTLQNGEPTTGKWYVIHSIFAHQGAAAAALEAWGISYCVGSNKVAAVTGDIAAASIKPMLGGGGYYTGMALVDLAATVVDDLWSPITDFYNTNLNSAVAGAIDRFVDGMIILKPGSCLSLKGVATTTSITLRLGVRWFEVDANELI